VNIQVNAVGQLAEEPRSEVLRLVRAATSVDGVAPLSEQVLLAGRGGLSAPAGNSCHFLAYAGTHLAGYAYLDQVATAELVVDPADRQRGLGTTLIRSVEEAAVKELPAPASRPLNLWSHGDLPAARALALRHGYSKARELWQMRRSLQPDAGSLPAVSLPEGFRSRHLVVGQDEEAWLRVNARAFVDHPEQGRITRRDLDQRMGEPWFDARGLILIEDTRGPAPVLAASHWTKVVPAGEPGLDPAALPTNQPTNQPSNQPTEGEVYVVGVDPAYQGLGLGRAVTVLGLSHLLEKGLAEAMLYVDGDNRAAVATYSRLDFTRCAVDIMYSRTVRTPL
jgi:mycothiol synthase